jgi:chemotaxis protein methyltransferase CheR
MSEFVAIPNAHQTHAVIAPDRTSFGFTAALRSMISFAELNLIEDWPMQGSFDVIFCRNVAIYFDAETQMTLWNRFTKQLSPKGFLFVGHSERISGPAIQQLTSVGVTAYANASYRQQK